MRRLFALVLPLAAAIGHAAIRPNLFVPRTSIDHAWDVGVRAHTNHIIYVGPDLYPSHEEPLIAELLNVAQASGGGLASPAGFHPTDFQSVYGDHNSGSGTIAIVDAYHLPTSLADFNTFSTQFGLPTEPSTDSTLASNAVFQVMYASRSQPAADGGWGQEIALDIEWSHAMAPGAKVVLVEAASSNFTDLMQAVDVAAGLPGVSQVSISWGGSEFPGESTYDSHFVHAGVTFFASTGDVGGSRNYPAMSPNVVAVGGTSLTFPGGVATEHGWSGSGGGMSLAERMPPFQDVLLHLLHNRRGAPDIAAVGDPSTGAAVYDSTAYQGFVGWFTVGGTSLSCPLCAAIANAGGARRGGSELAYIYSHPSAYGDVTVGSAGANRCKRGWDMVAGYGSPRSAGSL